MVFGFSWLSCSARPASQPPQEPSLDVQWLRVIPADECKPEGPFAGDNADAASATVPPAKNLELIGDVCGDYERCGQEENSSGIWFRKIRDVLPKDREALRPYLEEGTPGMRMPFAGDASSAVRTCVGLYWDGRNGNWVLGSPQPILSANSRNLNPLDGVRILATSEKIAHIGFHVDESPWNAKRWRWTLLESGSNGRISLSLTQMNRPQLDLGEKFIVKAPHAGGKSFSKKVSGEYEALGGLFRGRPCYVRDLAPQKLYTRKASHRELREKLMGVVEEEVAQEAEESKTQDMRNEENWNAIHKVRNRFNPPHKHIGARAVLKGEDSMQVKVLQFLDKNRMPVYISDPDENPSLDKRWDSISVKVGGSERVKNKEQVQKIIPPIVQVDDLPTLMLEDHKHREQGKEENEYTWVLTAGFVKVAMRFPFPGHVTFEKEETLDDRVARRQALKQAAEDPPALPPPSLEDGTPSPSGADATPEPEAPASPEGADQPKSVDELEVKWTRCQPPSPVKSHHEQEHHSWMEGVQERGQFSVRIQALWRGALARMRAAEDHGFITSDRRGSRMRTAMPDGYARSGEDVPDPARTNSREAEDEEDEGKLFLYWAPDCACWAVSKVLGSCNQHHWVACSSGCLWQVSRPWEVQENGGSWVLISSAGLGPLRGVKVSLPPPPPPVPPEELLAKRKAFIEQVVPPPKPAVWPEPFYTPPQPQQIFSVPSQNVHSAVWLGPKPDNSIPMKSLSDIPDEVGECAHCDQTDAAFKNPAKEQVHSAETEAAEEKMQHEDHCKVPEDKVQNETEPVS
eukprot:gnl/MRDRNA2_/MRDRNA2_84330_c0_seq1.p1 gnl/MRDRNA2_/MRDRNA2_84330_c0~~gnl/MRDRNA2_/MRDRNA2_84330_c0_seq1.p1  ORF type:complete len:800 (+),score=163.30 gnl/MRDRNA2_/MRDRNA2_84330_c0_seq1:144-2543(+)